MLNKIGAIIIKTSYESLQNTDKIEVFGKPLIDWVKTSLNGASSVNELSFSGVDFIEKILPVVDRGCPICCVLFSDTPLITKKTILDAVHTLNKNNLSAIKLTRGFVFRTDYLISLQHLPHLDNFYFDEEDFITAFNYRQVALICDILKSRIASFHLSKGVFIEDVAAACIGPDVQIGTSVKIFGATKIMGKSIIEKNTTIHSSNICDSIIKENCSIGPWANIRPACVIGENSRIGNFVELKSAKIGKNTKVAHLTYIGDAEVGENCNIGCGVVFVNYDGKNKHKSVVKDNVFIGSNCNVVAPVTIESGAFVAAGSTITSPVSENSLAIARARQVVKENWGKNPLLEKQKEEGE